MNNNNIYVQDVPNKGKGIFASKPFSPNEVILRFDGKNVAKDLAYSMDRNYSSNLLQIGEELYIDLLNDYSFFVNHSCVPNSFIKIAVNTAFLVCLIPIKIDDEITFDYSTTETGTPDVWSMNCKCGNFTCRKTISGFSSLSEENKNSLLKQDVLPDYMKKLFKP